jgi:hypothetical protein
MWRVLGTRAPKTLHIAQISHVISRRRLTAGPPGGMASGIPCPSSAGHSGCTAVTGHRALRRRDRGIAGRSELATAPLFEGGIVVSLVG